MQGEGASHPDLALQCHISPKPLGNAADDRQTKSRTLPVGAGGVETGKALPDPFVRLGRNADTAIRNSKECLTLSALHRHGDGSMLGRVAVFDGISDQITKQARQQVAVGADENALLG